MKQLVSVIIPVWNRRHLIERAVKSVLRQTYSPLELIVVNDGSTDGTPEDLKQFHQIRIIHQTRQGVATARNAGIRLAKGSLIAFLDSDDEWLPEKLEKQVRFFESRPKTWICQTDEIWIRNGKRVNPMAKHQKRGGWIFKECLPLCIISPSAVMMKRGLFEHVGVFDPSFPACEDYDLWLRASLFCRIELLPEKLVIKYGGHADQLSRTIPSLDRFRIRAIEKILRSDQLSAEQRRLAYDELKTKCRIYGRGCLKHGRQAEGEKILSLPLQKQSLPSQLK